MAVQRSDTDIYRESCVYVSAEIQGELEKKKGIRGTRSRKLCSLQGFTLYLQKKQGGVVKTIDLREAHQVRKVTTEQTGTHFEICIKKKTHVFICPSSENCSVWVKALQTAMALKYSSHQNTSISSDAAAFIDDKYVYNEMDETLISASDQDSLYITQEQPELPAKLCDYTEPCDKQSVTRKRENDYWDVIEVRENLGRSDSVTGAINSCNKTAGNLSDELVYDNAASQSAMKSSSDKNSYVYSTVQKNKKGLTSDTSQNAKTAGEKAENTTETIEILNSSQEFCDSPCMRGNGHDYNIVKFSAYESDNVKDEGDILFQTLADALTDRSSPIRDFIHPLTEEDIKPVIELKEFLINNHETCRASYTYVTVNDDPVGSFKSYLITLEMTFGK